MEQKAKSGNNELKIPKSIEKYAVLGVKRMALKLCDSDCAKKKLKAVEKEMNETSSPKWIPYHSGK